MEQARPLSEIRVFKLIVQYDGSAFHGWHDQTNAPTVVRTLKRSFKGAFGQECLLRGASRTDAGVHALFQVVRLESRLTLPDDKVLIIFNSSLPKSIRVLSLETAAQDFNPLAGVLLKEYQYKILKTKPIPLSGSWGWYCNWRDYINWERFAEVLDVFKGSHNFRAFCKIEQGEEPETVREIIEIKILVQDQDQIVVSVKGKGFLRYQVRRMIGCALEFAKKPLFERSIIESSLATGKPLPPQLDFRASAQGLCLMEIIYENKK